MKPVIFFYFFLFATPVFSNSLSAERGDTTAAVKIFDQSRKAYSRLKMYLDSGKLVKSFYNTEKPHTATYAFKTAYLINGQFNFDCYEVGKSNSLYTINRSANTVQTWWGISNEVKAEETLDKALQKVSGACSSSSVLIPSLLLRTDFKTDTYNGIKNPALVGSESVNGVNCYKITGKAGKGATDFSLWISKEDFFIRKIEKEERISAAEQSEVMSKTDSLLISMYRILHRQDSLMHRLDSVTNRIKFLTDGTESSVKETKKRVIPKRDPNYKATGMNIKSTYFFFPYTPKKLNPELFKFRPNREVKF
ncbi:MAG: DUF2092 domain-containing protein [Sphingobacteriaceae bacterium]|nr:DUF2092 domain-containing protein [Sphingobacteriaceae bacterium]